MKFRLPLTSIQKDFYGPIIEAILKYYPLEIKSDAPAYFEFSGQVELGKIIVDNIHSRKNFKARWQDFDKEIRTDLKKRIDGQTYATRPSFSSSLIIKKFKHNELIHIKTLHYSVSLVGPFFTIYGVDETAITDKRDGHDLFYTAINIITISPYKEFESDFNFIKSKIENRFKGYKFIPFDLHSRSIQGLYDPYKDDEEYTIYRALFDDFLNGYDTYRKRGDYKYGFDEWVKYKDGEEPRVTFGPPYAD
jgi:hypothetical protein